MVDTANPILGQIAKYLSDTLQLELLNTGRVASEALFNSIESIVEGTMSQITITTQGLFYAKHVNAGRAPGVRGVPLNVLTEWIRRKKIDLQGKSAESVAFVMQRSIKQKGIKRAPFIDKSLRKFQDSKRTEKQVERFMSQFLDTQLQTIFNQLTT